MTSLVTAQRKGKDAEWLILHNRSLSASAAGRISLAEAPKHAALFDQSRGVYVALSHRFADGRLTVDVNMPPYSLWCVRISDELPKTERRPVFLPGETVKASWQVTWPERGKAPAPLVELGDWRRWPGMESYAGTVRYRTTIKLAVAGGSAIGLDAGRVEEIAELTVNGKPLGARIHPPYLWDISAAARPGDNQIVVDVTNSASARWRDSFSHGDAVSGLLGPVTIVKSAPARSLQSSR
jgi:hypothetical protein